MGEAYPELRAQKERVARSAEAGGRALRRDARERHEGAGRRACHRARQDARRRDGVPALRHLRLPARPHRRHRARARRERRLRGLRGGDERAARPRARRVAVQDRRGGRLRGTRKTEFRGYDTLSEEGRVVALYKEGATVESLTAGDSGVVVLDRTPFYAESGGQVGDRGELGRHPPARSPSTDTQKMQPEVFGHHGELKTGEPASRRHGAGAGRTTSAPAHDAQSLGDAPHAQGAARGARHARAAEGLAGRSPRRRASTSRTTRR